MADLNNLNSFGLNDNNPLGYNYDASESRLLSWYSGFKLIEDPGEFFAGPYCFGWRSSVSQPISNNGSVSAFGQWTQQFFNYAFQGYSFGYAEVQADYWVQLYGLFDYLFDDLFEHEQYYYDKPDGTSPTNVFGSGQTETIYDDVV